MDPLIKLVDVKKCYSSGPACEIFPLAGVSLELFQGDRVILLGKSGSGKSTFLNIVGGVDSPTEGRVFFDGREITRMTSQDMAHFRRKEVGFIFQSFNLFPTLTVGENVTLPLDLLGIRDYSRAHELLIETGLDGYWKKFPEALSGGEQQRVAIARALVKRPRVILADEPTGNLDQETGNGILNLIDKTCRESDATLIMVTHSPDALWMAPRRYRLKSGMLMEEHYNN
jgi:putative ABC transport system ATP-binding protein